jgi:hypothetical protein
MRRSGLIWVLVVALVLSSAGAASASGTRRVIWTGVTVGSRDKRPELERFLKQVIDRQTGLTNWGVRRASPIEARLDVTEFSVARTQDVVRVTCTGVGKLKSGQAVRSHFSMGARPVGQAELERQLLTMLGRGIVNRLAEIARARH